MAWPCSSVTVTHHVVPGFCAAARARSRASAGSTGPMPGISPGRPARSVRVASGTVRVTRPANPPGAAPAAGPPAGNRPDRPDPARRLPVRCLRGRPARCRRPRRQRPGGAWNPCPAAGPGKRGPGARPGQRRRPDGARHHIQRHPRPERRPASRPGTPADLRELLRRQLILRAGIVLVLPPGPLRLRDAPGGIIVPPGIRRNRPWRHAAPSVRDIDLELDLHEL